MDFSSSPIQRVGVVAYEKGTCILTTEDPDGARGLPGKRIFAADMTRTECEEALCAYVKLRYTNAVLTKVTEFEGEWDGKPAHIIVYVLSGVWTNNERVYMQAAWVDLSTSNPPRFGPSISKLMAARAHAVPESNTLQTAAA